MARIRSVHPGLFTDEAFMCLSCDAQIFLIGLWTEADDQGAFEWKPITLRARLRPAKDGSVEDILSELEAVNCIKSYEHGGRKLGLIRNFRRYQRPKKPNSVHFIPAEFRTYTGLEGPSSEPDGVKGDPVPQQSELAPQREEEGGRRLDGGEKQSPLLSECIGAQDAPSGQGQQASKEHDLGKIPEHLDRRTKPPPSELKPKPKRRQLSALPETCPDEFERAWAMNFWRQNQRDDLVGEIENQVQQFRDHHRAKGSRMADWPAAWRAWVRNVPRFNRPQGAIPIGREPAPSEAEVMAAFEREQVRGAARDAG